jgi:ABC-type transport system involved in multi-copper enzyme maturation permease subunit
MRQLYVLTANVFREMVRDRTVTLLFFAAIVLVVLSSFLGSLSLDEQRRILIHLGFGAIQWTAFGLAVFQGAFALQKEIERQTCLMVLARPVSRSSFLLSKYLGIAALVLLHILFQGLLLFALLRGNADAGRFLIVLFGMFLENLILLAFVMLLSQWVRPVVGVFGGIGLFLVGNWLEEMKFLAQKTKDEGFEVLSQVFHNIFPNLYLLNFRSERFLDVGSDLNLGFLTLHFGLWLGLFLLLSTVSFSRRDLV